jgi:hypothetical protein
MQKHATIYREGIGVCFRKSALLGVPWNKVQTDNRNISGTIHQDALLAQWQAGYRLRVASYLGYRNRGAHEELELRSQPVLGLRLLRIHGDGNLEVER